MQQNTKDSRNSLLRLHEFSLHQNMLTHDVVLNLLLDIGHSITKCSKTRRTHRNSLLRLHEFSSHQNMLTRTSFRWKWRRAKIYSSRSDTLDCTQRYRFHRFFVDKRTNCVVVDGASNSSLVGDAALYSVDTAPAVVELISPSANAAHALAISSAKVIRQSALHSQSRLTARRWLNCFLRLNGFLSGF